MSYLPFNVFIYLVSPTGLLDPIKRTHTGSNTNTTNAHDITVLYEFRDYLNKCKVKNKTERKLYEITYKFITQLWLKSKIFSWGYFLEG